MSEPRLDAALEAARAFVPWALAALLLASPGVAQAQLLQPDGTVIPAGNNLVNFLNANGETINPLTDAATTPETFKPECQLTFTVLGRGAGQKNSFGWYNVTGIKPTIPELFEFINCNDGVGTVKVLDIRADTRYVGGEIGFFEATTEGHDGGGFLGGGGPNCVNFADPANTLGHVYYSEKVYNEDNVPGAPSYVHLLIMDSKVLRNTFYFGWEDLFQGGDNDFEDLLTRVEGIQCSGGGAECQTTELGVCSVGVMQCVNGTLTCVKSEVQRPEKCNALDDDCNGQVDDGDLCAAGEICDLGKCIKACGGGEFQCPVTLQCRADGYCIDPRCEGVLCASGQVCVAGTCRGACDGIACPFGEVCRGGACLDPCDGKECEVGQICEMGVCVSCECGGGCPNGKVCNQDKTQCVPPPCAAITCPLGQHCEPGGTCLDDCAGAACPRGQACTAGECLLDPNAPSPDAGQGGAGGSIFGGGSGSDTPVGGGSTIDPGAGGVGNSNGADAGASADSTPAPALGCGCRVASERRGSTASLVGAAAALALVARRARRVVRRRR